MLYIIENPKSHCVYFDNFFNSYALLHQLKEMQIRATGTILKNRTSKCTVESSKTEKSPKGAYDPRFHFANQILVVKWIDNKCVLIATNVDTNKPVASTSRWDRLKKYLSRDLFRIITNIW